MLIKPISGNRNNDRLTLIIGWAWSLVYAQGSTNQKGGNHVKMCEYNLRVSSLSTCAGEWQ